jgi:nicotinamidase-related amidase
MVKSAQEWLMVIDHQPAFAHPDSPWFCAAMVDVAPKIARLAPLFGDRVIFTRFVPPAEPFGSWVDYYRRWDFALNPASDWLWDLSDEWRGKPSIANHTFSKWIDSAKTLFGPDPKVTMCGVSTDCCVLATAFAAVDDGAQIRVVADACAAGSDEIQNAALAMMSSRAPQLSITTTDEECRRLQIAA